MTPSRPQIVLNKGIEPKQWDIWKLATDTKELRTWTEHFTETNCSHSNYFFHYNQWYFIQACVPLPFVTIICAVYHCLYAKIVKTKQTHLIRTLFTKISAVTKIMKNKKGGIDRGYLTLRNSICCHFSRILFLISSYSGNEWNGTLFRGPRS